MWLARTQCGGHLYRTLCFLSRLQTLQDSVAQHSDPENVLALTDDTV